MLNLLLINFFDDYSLLFVFSINSFDNLKAVVLANFFILSTLLFLHPSMVVYKLDVEFPISRFL